MKKLILALICGLLLTSCAPADDGSGSGPAESGAGSAQSAVASSSEEARPDESKPEEPKPEPKPEEPEAVKAAVQMYEGAYRDANSYSDMGGYFEGDTFFQYDYYELEVKNITETSFDFTLILYAGERGEMKTPREVTSGTARFVEDGTKAVCKDLTFLCPNGWDSLPDVVDIRIEGYEPVKDVVFANNDVPGYEFS